MIIRNSEEARFFWFMVKHENGIMDKDLVKEMKQAVRTWAHRPESIGRIFNEDVDGYTAVYPLPERINSKAEAVEFFEENERMTCRPSAYDCTGQLFTSWYKVIQKNGRFWVYHRVSRDI